MVSYDLSQFRYEASNEINSKSTDLFITSWAQLEREGMKSVDREDRCSLREEA
jgi:hypothetical protein